MPDPPDPTGSAPLTLLDGLVQVSFEITARLQRRAAAYELSLPLARLLGILRDREPSMLTLARLLDLDKSSVTGLVDRAERRGLVRRARAPSDQRVVLVRVTEEGRALITRVADEFAGDVAALTDELSAPRRADLARLLGDLLLTSAAERGVDLRADQAGTSGGAITE